MASQATTPDRPGRPLTPVVVQPRAEADVDEVAERIASADLAAALRFYDGVGATPRLLSDHPLVGSRRTSTATALAGLRSYGGIGLRNYPAFLVPGPQAVQVIRVLHAARDTDATMGPLT